MQGGVLIVGGGIAGFGLARALSLHGVSSTIVERMPGPPASGLGINLPGNALRALAALGVAEKVSRTGMRIRRREYRAQSGRALFAVDEEAFWGEVGPSVCLRRTALLDVLRAGVDQTSVRWGVEVVRVDSADRSVRVQLAPEVAEEYDYVVGADGVHSAVRSAVAGDDNVRPSLMSATSWRFLAPNPGVECWTVWSGRDSTFLLIPIDRENVYGYASTTRGGAGIDDPDRLADVSARFPRPVREAVAAALAAPDGLYHSPVEEVHAERWSRQRITLIGDAAHAMGPVWAQGAALALEDGLVLAELLATRSDWDAVGTEFERLKRPRVERVRAATDRMSRIAGLPIWLRDVVGPVLGPRAYREAYGPLRSPVSLSL